MPAPVINSSPIDPRLAATRVLLGVIENGRNLDQSLQENIESGAGENSLPLIKALVYGVLRHYFQLRGLCDSLLRHPVKAKDRDLLVLMMLGLFQLRHHSAPEYAVVAETVNTASMLGKPWAKGLLNAVLRNYLRQPVRALATESARYNAPPWIISQLREDWPQHWQALLQANTAQAPMVLRVNSARINRDDYRRLLADAGIDGVALEGHSAAIQLNNACDVNRLPGFDRGWVSVQDAAGQRAAPLLAPEAGQRVLDACAAPGGKTLHILECQPGLDELCALEVDATRAVKIRENLHRSGYVDAPVTLHIADAASLDDWWDGRLFQRILLDAPCSGTGVIRRHPDIQILRRPADIPLLVMQQARLLRMLWKTLAPGGCMVYCTCSVLKAENERQIQGFLRERDDAQEHRIEIPQAIPCESGAQIMTGSLDRDGFFYAKLQKRHL